MPGPEDSAVTNEPTGTSLPSDAEVAPADSAPPRRQARGQAKIDALVRACADIILQGGPTTVTHRSVTHRSVTHRAIAQRAGVSLASTTYYFQSLDQIIEAAGVLLVADWVRNADDAVVRAQKIVSETQGRVDSRTQAELLVRAVLPAGDDAVIRGHYEHLVGAGRSRSLAAGYAQARADFDGVIGQLLTVLSLATLTPAMVVALVDGAAVAALSEGRPVRTHARTLLTPVIDSYPR